MDVDSTKLVKAVAGNKVLVHCTKEDGPLSTVNKRASYFLTEFPAVMPVE